MFTTPSLSLSQPGFLPCTAAVPLRRTDVDRRTKYGRTETGSQRHAAGSRDVTSVFTFLRLHYSAKQGASSCRTAFHTMDACWQCSLRTAGSFFLCCSTVARSCVCNIFLPEQNGEEMFARALHVLVPPPKSPQWDVCVYFILGIEGTCTYNIHYFLMPLIHSFAHTPSLGGRRRVSECKAEKRRERLKKGRLKVN